MNAYSQSSIFKIKIDMSQAEITDQWIPDTHGMEYRVGQIERSVRLLSIYNVSEWPQSQFERRMPGLRVPTSLFLLFFPHASESDVSTKSNEKCLPVLNLNLDLKLSIDKF